MCSLEILPNEILAQIMSNLRTKDLRTCRIVSSFMREKIDRISPTHLYVIFNEKSEQEFMGKRKPSLIPPFTQMKVKTVSYFNGSNDANAKPNKKTLSLRKEYFQNITELDITEFVPKRYFHQIIKLTQSLRVLKMSSAVLGGAENLFGKDVLEHNSMLVKPRPMLFFRRALPQPLIQNILESEQNGIRTLHKSKKWSKLEELHIKLDYICPSTPNFSPHWLVKNLKIVQYLPVPKLKAYSVTVEKSKDAEMFFFTINSLLNTIPTMSYSSLKSVRVVSPKCRPISQQESLKERQKNKNKKNFSLMQLSNLTVKICEGHVHHAIPDNLLAILQAQQQSLRKISIEGVRNPHFLNLLN